jgi:hypothetical protein
MASHMSTIGFQVSNEFDFGKLVNHALLNGTEIESANGMYIWWVAGRGVELWVQIDRDKSVVGVNPHFSHSGRMWVGLTQRLRRPDESSLEGAFHGWAAPQGDDPESGAYPFIFDAPDFDLHEELQLPSLRQVQVAAFAHELEAFVDEDSYYASQAEGVRFAAESFIPAGLFSLGHNGGGPPAAQAVLAGTVLAWENITNPFSGRPFHWARVRTLGGEIDIVTDPSILIGELVEGGIVRGSFWLSGRILD